MIDLRETYLPVTKKSETTPGSEALTLQSIEQFQKYYNTPEATQFADELKKISTREHFPHELFDPAAQSPEYQQEKFDLSSFLDGLYTSQQMEGDQEKATWDAFAKLRLDAKQAKEGDIIVPHSLTEAAMIGFLIGRKIERHDATYLPEDLLKDPTDTDLLKLTQIAEKLYPVFLLEHGEEASPTFASIQLKSERN